MQSGRKPIPTYLKIVKKTARKGRLNPREARIDPAIPIPPAWLPDELKAEFLKRAAILFKKGLITEIDHPALIAVTLTEEVIQIIDKLWREQRAIGGRGTGILVQEPGSKMIRNDPLLIARATAVRDLVRYGAELGMTPSSRSRIAATPPAEDDDDEFKY